MLEHGIALGLVDTQAGLETGAAVDVSQRGQTLTATLSTIPFVRRGQFASSK
jgi:glycine cleavage system aminomethyltransferase T